MSDSEERKEMMAGQTYVIEVNYFLITKKSVRMYNSSEFEILMIKSENSNRLFIQALFDRHQWTKIHKVNTIH